MRKRALGRTGIEVSELAMGGLFVSSIGGQGIDGAARAIHRAFDLGVNWIDTAPTYADSEAVIGHALEGSKAEYFISTKLGGRPQPFDPRDRDALRRSFDESLRLLRRDRVDLLFVHEPDRPGQYDWWTDRSRFHGPVTELLEDLRSEGLIRFTGLGGTTAYEMARVIDATNYDVVLTAFNYSLLWREAERAVLPAAEAKGLGILIGSPLQQGALARRYDDEIERGAPWLSPPRRAQYRELYAFERRTGVSLSELGIRFPLNRPSVSTVLMGARSVEEVEANVRAVEAGPLTDDWIADLDRIASMVPFRPFEEPFGLPFGREYHGPGAA